MATWSRSSSVCNGATPNVELGVSVNEAGRLIEEINWAVFGPVTAFSFAASRLRSKHLPTRVKWILDLMFGVIFTSPFRRSAVPSNDAIAFNVTVCPLAQYCREQGVPELTRYAACSLDHRMANNWGVRLMRTQTIADGDPHCDFRFRVPQQSGIVAQQSVQADGPAGGGAAA